MKSVLDVFSGEGGRRYGMASFDGVTAGKTGLLDTDAEVIEAAAAKWPLRFDVINTWSQDSETILV